MKSTNYLCSKTFRMDIKYKATGNVNCKNYNSLTLYLFMLCGLFQIEWMMYIESNLLDLNHMRFRIQCSNWIVNNIKILSSDIIFDVNLFWCTNAFYAKYQ